MADPTRLDFGDYLSAAMVSIIAGVSAAMAWFSGSKRLIHGRIDNVEASIKDWERLHSAHATQLAVVQTCQENTRVTLLRLEEAINKMDNKLDAALKP